MSHEGEHRTFVKLDRYEREILRRFKKWEKTCTGKNLPTSTIIRGVIRDYWNVVLTLAEHADTDLRKKLMDGVETELKFANNISKLPVDNCDSVLSMKIGS